MANNINTINTTKSTASATASNANITDILSSFSKAELEAIASTMIAKGIISPSATASNATANAPAITPAQAYCAGRDERLLKAAIYAAFAISGKNGSIYSFKDIVTLYQKQLDYIGGDFAQNVSTLYDTLLAIQSEISFVKTPKEQVLDLLRTDKSTALVKAKEKHISQSAINEAILEFASIA